MTVLVACEHSQKICKAFREQGCIAFSCDILECSGGHPEWHIKGDVLPLLNGNCFFTTQDGKKRFCFDRWGLIIAHPPCTFLSKAATSCHSTKVRSLDYIKERTFNRIAAINFFMKIVSADCEHIVIENPVGVMSSVYRQPDQYIEPYYFCSSTNDKDYVCKKTGLWLKGVKPLIYDCTLTNPMATADTWSSGKRKSWTECKNNGFERSITFDSIANAMAEQWSVLDEI